MTAPRSFARRAAFWALFTATLAVYLAMLIWSLPRISASAGGLLPFDLRPGGYSLEEATAFLAALSPETRAFYLGPQHWLDLIYPALLGLTLIWATLWVFRTSRPGLKAGLVLPAAAGAMMDWIENARVAGLLRAEALTPDLVRAASYATVAKSVAVTLAVLVVLAGLAWRGWQRWAGRA